jgi:excisionase family DNA binding protein
LNDRLITAAELADYLGLSASTILDRWEAGDLPGFRLFGRKGGPVRFRLSEIEAILESWRHGTVCSSSRAKGAMLEGMASMPPKEERW